MSMIAEQTNASALSFGERVPLAIDMLAALARLTWLAVIFVLLPASYATPTVKQVDLIP